MRSPTAIHIIVRMPIAPTSERDRPRCRDGQRHHARARGRDVEHLGLRRDREVLLAVVARDEHAPHLGLDPGGRAGASREVDLGQLVLVEEALARPPPGRRPVVDVEAEDLALGLHDPDDEEAPAADADALAERASSRRRARARASARAPPSGAAPAGIARRQEAALADAEPEHARACRRSRRRRARAAAVAGTRRAAVP